MHVKTLLPILLTFLLPTITNAAHPPPEEIALAAQKRQIAIGGGAPVATAANSAAATTTYAASLITAGGTTTTEWVAFTQTFNESLGTWVFPTALSGSVGLGSISGTVG